MQWLSINWYIVVAVISAHLLGWGIGVWYGAAKGYKAAQDDRRQIESQMKWRSYFNQLEKRMHELKNMEAEYGKDENGNRIG